MFAVFMWAGLSRLCSHYNALQLLRLAPIQKPYQIGLMFTQNSDSGVVSETPERSHRVSRAYARFPETNAFKYFSHQKRIAINTYHPWRDEEMRDSEDSLAFQDLSLLWRNGTCAVLYGSIISRDRTLYSSLLRLLKENTTEQMTSRKTV